MDTNPVSFLSTLQQCSSSRSLDLCSLSCGLSRDILALVFGFTGGPLYTALLPEKTEVGPVEIQDNWIDKGEDFSMCLRELLRREYALLEISSSIGLLQLWGFWNGNNGGSLLVSPENNICLEMISVQSVHLYRSGGNYQLSEIFSKPDQFCETVVATAVRTVHHTFLSWCAQECRFGKAEIFFGETGSKDLDHLELKQHRVGKFRRRKKHSLLKRKKRVRLSDHVKSKKKKKTIKARVHRKKTYMSF